MVFVGTSFAVNVTEACIQQAADFALPAFIIDPGQKQEDWRDNFVIVREKAEVYLPAVVEAL